MDYEKRYKDDKEQYKSLSVGEIKNILTNITGNKEDVKNVLVDYIRKKMTRDKAFYYQGKEVSWEEIPYDVRKHDYPYYFKGDIDYYPFTPNLI